MYTVDVIIPTFKPQKDFFRVLDLLEDQTVKPRQIILMNTEEVYFNKLIYGTKFAGTYRNCTVRHLSQNEFDHGKTRNQGVALSKADYFVMMTQDAVPADKYLIENLIKPIAEKKAAVTYARQLPKEDCNPIERYTRSFNYPDDSLLKGEGDIPQLGIKTYFCSDVCAAYDRQIFDELGGFVNRAVFNEDMVYAAKAAQAGHKIGYCADARVYHSHNYTAGQQFHRNFDIGASQTDHPEVFGNLRSENEGIRMVIETVSYLWHNGYKRYIPKLFLNSGAKWIGYRLGKGYRKLTVRQILRFTSNPVYWKKWAMKKDTEKIDATKGYAKNPKNEGE